MLTTADAPTAVPAAKQNAPSNRIPGRSRDGIDRVMAVNLFLNLSLNPGYPGQLSEAAHNISYIDKTINDSTFEVEGEP